MPTIRSTSRPPLRTNKVGILLTLNRAAVAGLGRSLFRRHVPPSVSNTFPSGFTTINFLSLAHIVPKLIDVERRYIAALESDLAAINDADARAAVEKLLAVKKRHLPQLETLLTAQPQPASA